MKICAYIAGDKNIIYPAIVCLSSIKKYNQDIDLFLFSERQFANKEQLSICDKYNINFIDIKEIDSSDKINIFSNFDRWPAHVFYNYMAPDFLYAKGYNYAIKLDYDMICINPFVINEILPEKTQVISVLHKGKISGFTDKSSLEKLKKKFVIDDYRTANVGFLVLDLEYFNRKNVFNTFIDIFTYVSTNKIYHGAETLEQFCFGLLQCVLKNSFKPLPYTYNFRPYYERREINNIVKILHYNFKQKPWQPIIEDFLNTEKDRYMRFVIATAYWIEHANSLNFTEDWYENKNISLKSLFNIYNKSIDIIDKNNRKALLENYISFLQEKDSSIEDIVYDKNYRYVQIRMFSEKDIHYELLFKNNEITICIHFEQAWSKYVDYLQNTVHKQIRIDMTYAQQYPGIYHTIKEIKDIRKVCTATSTIIKQSYDSIANFITTHNIIHAILRNRDETEKLIYQRIDSIDEKIKYIYEATVGDKKDNSNFIFDTIYKQKIWEGTSGSGSNPANLQGYMSFLEKFIQENRITSIADIGCGDWQYMRQVNLKGITYTGYDVASTVIATNQQKFSTPNINFILYDGNFADIKPADLAICKDVLQHLPNKNIFDFIENTKKFKYILVANDIIDDMTGNTDIEMGQHRPLDLRLPPFNLAAESVLIIDRKYLKKPNIMVLLIKN